MQTNIVKRLGVWAIIVALLLLIPLCLLIFQVKLYDPGSGWETLNWTFFDFIGAGVLLFSAATVFELATLKVTNRTRRIIIGIIVLVGLAFVWAMLATG
jgi:hypothetical protein